MRKGMKSSSREGGIIICLFFLLLVGTFFYIFLVSLQDINLVNKDYIGLRTHSIEKKDPPFASALNHTQREHLPSITPQTKTKKTKRLQKKEFPDWNAEHWTPIHVVYSSDPQFELCRLDFKSYYETPHAYPMFKDFVQKSNCATHRKSYSSLMEEITLHQGKPEGRVVHPTGFVFHESRVGSTLVANMLASNPWAMVFSESSTGHDALLNCPHCSREEQIEYFKKVVTIMGRSPVHDMLFFKFQSATTTAISIALEAFPDVPWIFLYRHPVQTMVSHLLPRGAKGKITKMAPCLRSMHHESPALAEIMKRYVPEGTNSNDYEPWCAAHLNLLCESAISAYEKYSRYDENLPIASSVGQHVRGALVNYDSLPGIIPKVVAPLFRESSTYSKSRTQGQREFSGDSEDKEERATDGIVNWAEKILQPSYDIMDKKAKEVIHIFAQSISVESEIDWSDWKEMPSANSIGDEIEKNEPGDEPADLSEIPSSKILPLMRDVSDVDDIASVTGDSSNKYDLARNRIEPGILATGVNSIRFEEITCPDKPPADYPRTYHMEDLLRNWNPDDVTVPRYHYNSLCYFDYQTELHKASNYRDADLPYILYNIPEVNQIVEKWKSVDYLNNFFGDEEYHAEISAYHNHFLYFSGHDIHHKYFNRSGDGPWKPPTSHVPLTFKEWYDIALLESKKPFEQRKYYYFRADHRQLSDHLFEELQIFNPANSISTDFLHDKSELNGIHCRFGMPGTVAEAHYDGHLNTAGAFGGLRRWILAHPDQCDSLYLYPRGHPSARHSEFDWSHANYEKYPKFRTAQANEVILTGGMILFLPSNWFHYIVSLTLNYQCNIRSGKRHTYDQIIKDCGF